MPFTDIYRVVESVVNSHAPTAGETLEDLLAADAWAMQAAEGFVADLAAQR